MTTCSLADLAAAARRAVAAIGHEANQRYGTRKAFLAAVHATLEGRGSIHLEAFKQCMVAAHRAGFVVLARADLVAAMSRAAVAASEVSDGCAEFTSCSTMRPATVGRCLASPKSSQGGL